MFQKYVVFVFALSVRLPIFVIVFVFHPLLIVIKGIGFSPKGPTYKSLNKDYFYHGVSRLVEKSSRCSKVFHALVKVVSCLQILARLCDDETEVALVSIQLG